MLTAKEVAEVLRTGLLTVYKLIKEGKIPAYKIGRQWRVKRKDLIQYIEAQRASVSKEKTTLNLDLFSKSSKKGGDVDASQKAQQESSEKSQQAGKEEGHS